MDTKDIDISDIYIELEIITKVQYPKTNSERVRKYTKPIARFITKGYSPCLVTCFGKEKNRLKTIQIFAYNSRIATPKKSLRIYRKETKQDIVGFLDKFFEKKKLKYHVKSFKFVHKFIPSDDLYLKIKEMQTGSKILLRSVKLKV